MLATQILAGASPGWLGAAEIADLVAAYGMAEPSGLVATTPEEAVDALAALGGPVALKIDNPDIVHKSDLGGVLLGISSGEDARTGFETLAALSGISTGRATRVHVQQMVEPGQDVIVGGVRDSQFGPLIMFGSGGVEVEGLNDVEFALAPVTATDVAYLLAKTWAGRRLAGYRSIAPSDVVAVEDVLTKIGWLISNHPEIAEIEINPLRVRPPGSGAVAIDVRVRIG